jgi:hypothetical protein
MISIEQQPNIATAMAISSGQTDLAPSSVATVVVVLMITKHIRDG